MTLITTSLTIIVALLSALAARPSSPFEDDKSVSVPAERKVYLGFDRNEYPGDAVLPVFRKTFSFSRYWLTAPPRETHNTWTGKKKALDAQGFGFVLLARGREASTLQSGAKDDGITDARQAARNAKLEGFGAGSIVFLDIEEGGRLPPQFHSYLQAWADELVQQGFRPEPTAQAYPQGMEMDPKL